MSRQILRLWFFVTVMVLIPMIAFAATIIVDDDGPAAYRSIQRAIDAADPGDVIKVAEGFYEEHLEIRKNVRLIGAGPDETWIEFSGESATVLIKEVTDVVVRGFTIAYTGPELNDSFRAALWINNGTCVISENHITGSGRGILCTDGANVQITGNLIYWNRLNGVSGYSKVRITRLSDNEISGNEGDGIYLHDTTVENLTGNTIADNGKAGIAALSDTAITRLSENEIMGNMEDGVFLSSATVKELTGNVIEHNMRKGVLATTNTRITQLSENQIIGNEVYGIYLEATVIENLVDNVIQDNGGIGIITFSETRITKLSGNQITGNWGRGINLAATKVGTLANNDIGGNEHGIVATDGTQIEELSGNYIFSNEGRGINLTNTAIDALIDNIIRDNLSDGIALFSETRVAEITGNQIDGNEQDGISLVACAVEQIYNNTIVGNNGAGIKTDGNYQVRVRNNIIAWNIWGVALFQDASVGTLPLDLAYNNIWNNEEENYGDEVRPDFLSIHIDPMFVDPDNRDYHLQALSPMIGAGENGVDIGAIPAVIRQMEVSGSPATAGETITFSVVAEPNATVSFSIESIVFDIPMRETESGVYQGEYAVTATDRGIDLPIILRVETESGYIQIDTSQTATLSGGIRSVQVSGSPAKADDVIEVTLLADAGGYAEFSIQRTAYGIPMIEGQDGVYTGSYRVEHGDNADNAVLTVMWMDSDGQGALDQSHIIRIDTITVFAGSPVKADDVLTIIAAGKTGNSLSFNIADIGVRDVPLLENAAQPGIYTGGYAVKAGDNVEGGAVAVTVVMPSGDSFVNSTAVVTIDTAAPEIIAVTADKTLVKNGEVFKISLTSEPGAIVAMDIGMLDTTQSLVVLYETDQPGHYSREITISPANEALNGKKTLHITAIDWAGNLAESSFQIELSNLEDPTSISLPEAYISVQPNVLPADGMSTALIVASLGESITRLSEIALEARWESPTSGMEDPESHVRNAGYISDLQLVQQDHLTATYTSGLSVGEVTLTLTFLESGNQMSTHIILEPPGYEESSQISWDYLPRYAKIYQPLEISGKLLPPVGGEIVILTIASPGALASEIIYMETDPFGRFGHVLVPEQEGTWGFQLSWSGNAFYGGAQSEPRQIAVVASIPLEPLTEAGWSRLTTADGLTSNEITALAQDHEGRIWIGTDQGISVFDGEISYTFTTADGLLGNSITALSMDMDGQMWIGSAPNKASPGGLTVCDGLMWFHQLTEDVTSLSYVLALYEDHQGRMWIGGDGLTLYDGGYFQPIPLPVNGRGHTVSAFAEDMEGGIWIGTDLGLFRYHAGKWNNFTGGKYGLPNSHIQTLLVDSEGVLWAGTLPKVNADTQTSVGGGLARFNGRTFEIFNVRNSELPSNYVTSLMEDSEGQILIGMLNGGVVRFGEWETLSVELEGRSVTSLLQDNQRQVWIGTNAGVYRSDRQTFNAWRIVSGKGTFFQENTGVIWAGSENGLARFDGLTWDIIQEFWNVPVYCIAQHADGAIGVGNENGLAVYDGQNWLHLTEISGITLGPVTALISDDQGRSFLGTGKGTFMILQGGKWLNLTDKLGTEGISITDFTIDTNGVLWIGTEDGLLRYDGIEASSMGTDMNMKISDLAVDSSGNLWVATQKGLFRFYGATWRVYNIRNSEIASNNATSLAIDARGRVWIGTDSGISRFDGLAFSYLAPEDAWVTYTSQNSDLVDDNIGGLFVDSFGELWISTSSMVIRFAANLRPPDTMITRAPISTVGTDSPLFEYTGADIESETADLVYSYKIDSGDWSPYSRNIYVVLRHQKEGVHTFFVRAMDKDSNVDPTPAQRSFIIDTVPPVVAVISPAARQVVGDEIEIRGHAIDESDFESYTVKIKNGANQEVFSFVDYKPVRNDILALWNTTETPDGNYVIILTAKDRVDGPDDAAHTSTAIIPVTVDNLPPEARITSPVSNRSLSGVISIRGQASDKNMESYRLTWTQDVVSPTYAGRMPALPEDTAWQLIASEEIYKSNLTVEQTWDSSAVYGMTTIRLEVSDRAGNTATSDVTIQLENTSAKPITSITSPVAGAVIAGIRRITGTASDSSFEGYRLDFGAGDQPSEWTEIITQSTPVTEGKLASWDTTTLSDGKYTLRLTAMDTNGYTSSVSIPVIVDNSRPVAVIYPPASLVRGKWIAAGDVDIIGTATDVNFDNYIVEFGVGNAPGEWTSIEGSSDQQVQDGILRTWSTAGSNGGYTLRLTVTNEAGLSSDFTQPVTLDNQQPEAAVISPEAEQFVTGKVAIIGTADDENLKQYQISVRQGEDPATWDMLVESSSPRREDVLFIWDTTQLSSLGFDTGFAHSTGAGRYSIKLVVEDYTSEPVEVIQRVTVDNTSPQAVITTPQVGQMVSGDLSITGTAQDDNFLSYLVEYAPGTNPSDDAWEEIEGLAIQPVTDGVLRRWNTAGIDDGRYSLRLTVTDNAGHVSTVQRVVILDNQPPEAELRVPTANGVVTGIIEIIGTASDANIEEYKVFISPGEQPEANDWQLIGSGTRSKIDSVLAEWDTASLEGAYSIKLIVSDRGDQEPAEDIQTVIIDNTVPVAIIASPRDNNQVGGVIQLIGTATDANFKEYVVEFGEGNSPQIWTKATTVEYRAPVEGGELTQWFPGERKGVFTLRLTVTDQVDHASAAAVTVNILSLVAKTDGGTRTSADGRATLYLPPRALSGDTLISINPAAETIPSDTILGQAYEIGPKTAKLSSNKPATLSISYDELSVIPSPDKRLVIARFNGSRWMPIGGTVNEEGRVITTAITEFGNYALMELDESQLETTTTITRLTCQPRIFSPNGSGFRTEATISFHLSEPATVNIMIYNRAGELVTTLKEDSPMTAGVNALSWNGKGDDGELPSNMYIIAVEAGDQIVYKTVGIANH